MTGNSGQKNKQEDKLSGIQIEKKTKIMSLIDNLTFLQILFI